MGAGKRLALGYGQMLLTTPPTHPRVCLAEQCLEQCTEHVRQVDQPLLHAGRFHRGWVLTERLSSGSFPPLLPAS